MNWQFPPSTLFLFVAATVNWLLALYAIRSRNSLVLPAFTLLLWATGIWAFGYGFELASPTEVSKLFWAKIQYLGIAVVPPAWLLLALQYTGRDIWLQRKRQVLFLLFLIPTITLLLAWTNERHGLIWAHTELVKHQNIWLLDYSYGRWFWVNIACSYLYMLLGSGLVIHRILRTPGIIRQQSIWMLVAALLPWISNALYLTGVNPFRLDLTPFAFTLSGIAVIGGAFRSQFLDITPIAHSNIIMKLDEGIFVLDAKERIIDVNPAGQRMVDLSLAAIVGKPVTDVFADWAAWMSQINQEQRAEAAFTLNRESRIYELRLTPLVTDGNAKQQGQMIVFYDITTRKQQEIQLNQARMEAVAAAKAKTDFLANMSHEIRTPLNAVIGMTGLLRDSLLNSEQQDLVHTIFTSSDTLLSIINNILDFSKVDAGKLELENEPFDLEDCVLAALDLVKTKAHEKGLQLIHQISPDTPLFCKGDALRLRQVLVNLLSNSVKFTDEGQVRVEVSSNLLGHAQCEILFAVRDTGIGIPADKVEMVFQSFSQADTSHTRKYGGTGLGLAISQRLVRLMGGKIWVKSEVGKGTTFFFTMPTEVATSEPKRYLRKKQLKLPGKRILFVANHSGTRRYMSRQIRTWGIHPYVAGSLPETVYWLQNSTPFDVIIVDEDMLTAEKDLLLSIRQLAHNTPLLLLTQQGRVPAEIQAHITGHVQKPIKPSALYEVLVDVLSVQKNQEGAVVMQGGAETAVSLPLTAPDSNKQPHTLRILLAEDNLINQKVAMRIMTKLGYEPDVVSNGREVLTALEKQSYQIVFMDVQMPEMDGVEATQCIHTQWPVEKRPWIIAMTAHALEGDRERYLSAGMDDYISKPVRIEDMVESIHRYQQKQASR
ncbi:MAG: response regulator [Ardenticatenaceae bacterium]|nr:response regulator [Ardenticatenaceae bacterium]